MPPTSNFGQDITNANENSGNRGDGGGNGGDPNGGGGGGGGSAASMIERMGGRMMLPKLAGRGVIRVVGRCDEAKENNMLSELCVMVPQSRCTKNSLQGWRSRGEVPRSRSLAVLDLD